jgi:hypothetical protein
MHSDVSVSPRRRTRSRGVLLAVATAAVLLADPHATAPIFAASPTLPFLAPTPYMGWSSWYGLRWTLDEASIVASVDRMVATGLRDAGYEYVWLDAGWWQGTRDGTGTITVSAQQWPHGMAALADYIHRAGMKAGIYTGQPRPLSAGRRYLRGLGLRRDQVRQLRRVHSGRQGDFRGNQRGRCA